MKKLFAVFVAAFFIVSSWPILSADAAIDDMDGTAKHLKEKFKVNDTAKNFKKVKVKYDKLGYKHVKVQQIAEGIPVYGSEYIVHFDKKGNIYSASGKFKREAGNFKIKGKFISRNAAIKAAENGVGFKKQSTSDEEYQADMISAELYLYNVNNEYIPVYLVKLNWLHEDSYGNWCVFVNAYSGKIVDKYDSTNYSTAKIRVPTSGTKTTGKGVGVLGDSKIVNLLLKNKTYYLIDKTKPMKGYIITYSANNTSKLPGTVMTDYNLTWNSSAEKSAVDANYYAAAVYDYFYNMFGRNSIDGKGMTIKSTVHYGKNYANAFWNGYQMVYGDGDGVEALALSGGVDVVAHELTHGVDSYEADLEYRNQSGALCESFSDVFGTAVEFAVEPEKADWLIGEDIWTPGIPGDALRSMKDPKAYGDPDNMKNYVYTTQDNGGVHTNSGIPNKAAYLIGSKIGVDKMAKIYYRALTIYLTPTSDFSDCKAALLQSAADLYGANGTEYKAVAKAFNAVEII